MIRIKNTLPPAAKGALFEKTAPLDPPQKLLIRGCFIWFFGFLNSFFLRVSSRNFAAKNKKIRRPDENR
jgi:hypothetical protein